jgi:hypothetical protein
VILRSLHVIASAAKQSILSFRGAMDCFVSLAMTVGGTYFAAARGGAFASAVAIAEISGFMK